MARYSSEKYFDGIDFCVTSPRGDVHPQSIQAPHGNTGSTSHDDLGGSLPWGCDQQVSDTLDQA